MADLSASGVGATRAVAIAQPVDWLRFFIIASGLSASILFVIVGVGYGLQMYADGSIFSYAIAAEDSWTFHWHNISGRIVVYLLCQVPAETYVKFTGDAYGGINFYGFLFFGAQLFGLIATWFADRSKGRVIFRTACISVACVCPLVFGYVTELWVSHALFWPALALCHYARAGVTGMLVSAAALTLLVLTHEGAVIFAVAIVCTAGLRGIRSGAFRRTGTGFLIAISLWASVKTTLRPDAVFADIVATLAFSAVNLSNFTSPVLLLLVAAIGAYGAMLVVLRRLTAIQAAFGAAGAVLALLIAYWMAFDEKLHAAERYSLRTALLIAVPLLGALAAWLAIESEDRLDASFAFLKPWVATLTRNLTAPILAGAVALVMLVHVVETAKFVTAWTDYKDAVARLAMSAASDAELGDPRFVSAERIGASENRLSWSSTTPFLSVLLAPGLAPQRLVVDPSANYVWFSCDSARASEQRDSVIPETTRRLIRIYTCLYR